MIDIDDLVPRHHIDTQDGHQKEDPLRKIVRD